MAKREDGGAAFPVNDGPKYDQHLGMSLRDYFAGQVANECLALGARAKASVMEIAEAAYEYADAMIAAREKETK